MTTEEKIKYAAWLSRVGLLRMGLARQSCLASGAVTTEVLRSLGITARPMTASVMAATEPWVRKMEAGNKPTSEETLDRWWEEDRAYSVGVMHDPIPEKGSWTAHLIVLAGPGESYLVDPSLDQLSRPQYDLPLEPLVMDMGEQRVFNQHEFRRGRTQAVGQFTDDDGGRSFYVIYSCFPTDRSFRTAPDFAYFQQRYGEMALSISQVIRQMHEDGLTGDSLPPLPPLPDSHDDPALIARPRPLGARRATAHP